MVSSGTCPVPKGALNYSDQSKSWHPMLYTAAAATGLTTIVALGLITQHLRRYRAPKEQRQIIRIVFSVVVYSIVAFFELDQYSIAQYIDPIGDLYEAFGLCALFLLYIQYAAPAGDFDDETFDAVKAAEEDTQSDYNWPKIFWVFVFQYPLILFFCIAAQEVTQVFNVYCLDSLSPKFAHLWVEIFESLSIGACVLAILHFRGRMKRLMKVRRAFPKLVAFKLIVFLRFSQQWVFSVLLERHYIEPSDLFSYNDILYGIPAVLTCVEMVFFALGFWYAFAASEYSSRAKPNQARYPIWKAILDALNPADLVLGIGRIFPLFLEVQRSGDLKRYRIASRQTGLQGAVRKLVAKAKSRRNGGDRYQEMDEGMESLTRPSEMHHQPTDDLPPRYSMTGGVEGHEMFQPPTGMPPQDGQGYLMTTSEPMGLPQGGRARSPSNGHWNGSTYGRSTSPAHSAGY